VVTSDWHVPYFNEDLLARMMLVAKNWKPEPITKLAIGGDFMDFGQLGIFLPEEEEIRRTVTDDLDAAEEVLVWLTTQFDDILCLKANHEARLSRALKAEIDQERIGQLMAAGLANVKFSNWSFCVIGDEWRVTHPGRRWKLPGRLAQELANRYQMNVILAHSHIMSLSYAISGGYTCIDSGGMFDPDALGYYSKTDAAYWAWCPAFVVISKGQVHTFNYKWTDWDMYADWLGVDELRRGGDV